jgi:hypothetical protein
LNFMSHSFPVMAMVCFGSSAAIIPRTSRPAGMRFEAVVHAVPRTTAAPGQKESLKCRYQKQVTKEHYKPRAAGKYRD